MSFYLIHTVRELMFTYCRSMDNMRAKVLESVDVFTTQIQSLAMDIERSVMYVGLCGGTVGVLTLVYEDEAETTTSTFK
jgi:hypothetical protein